MPEPLKNHYNAAYIQRLVSEIAGVTPQFPAAQFSALVLDDQWEARELKERMSHITRCLQKCLPEEFRTALAILTEVASKFNGFGGMFIPEFVERYGMEDWEASLPALALLTRYGSSEFAVRPFIKKDSERMMATMSIWAEDENHHVRRLASEGCRPRLPWAMALPDFKRDPTPVLPILEKLKDDPEEYVRRSVANNLNDIAKDHPEVVLGIAEKWLGANSQRDRLVKHACRTLLKAGNGKALALFGFGPPQGVTVSNLQMQDPSIRIGETAHFSFEVVCENPCRLRLEYEIEYVKAKAKRSRKVFKISEREYAAGSTPIKRHQLFRDFSTRKHYPGQHGLKILINGDAMAETTFHVAAMFPEANTAGK